MRWSGIVQRKTTLSQMPWWNLPKRMAFLWGAITFSRTIQNNSQNGLRPYHLRNQEKQQLKVWNLWFQDTKENWLHGMWWMRISTSTFRRTNSVKMPLQQHIQQITSLIQIQRCSWMSLTSLNIASGDEASCPAKYIKKLQEILSFPGVSEMSAAIGLQGHFASGQPNLAYMRSGLDLLATTGLPIWLTEASVDPQPSQVFPQHQKIFQ